MTWLNRLNNTELEVTTGDGKIYKPLWQTAEKDINFNTENFEFVGVPGTYIERTEKSGDQFPINFIFQGENCIDVAAEFMLSAADKRAWKIKHPYYDDILVQPLSLKQTNTVHNISRITGTVWETITTKFPEDVVVPQKEIENLAVKTNNDTISDFNNRLRDPSVNLVQPAILSTDTIALGYENLPVLSDDIELLKDLSRQASGAAQNLLNDVNGFITKTIALINFPLQIKQNIELKLNALKDNIDKLFDILDLNNDEQVILNEALVVSSMAQMSEVSVNPEITDTDIQDYQTRNDVVITFNDLNETYENIIEQYDAINYVQNNEMAIDLDIIVNSSLASLYEIAFNAKQERFINIEKDDNIINLAHRFFGPGDVNLETFINQNNITLDEHLIVKKGREIIWYV
jgi:hypothetical protein